MTWKEQHIENLKNIHEDEGIKRIDKQEKYWDGSTYSLRDIHRYEAIYLEFNGVGIA